MKKETKAQEMPKELDLAIAAYLKRKEESTYDYSSDGTHLGYHGSTFAKWGGDGIYIRLGSTSAHMLNAAKELLSANGDWLTLLMEKNKDGNHVLVAYNPKTKFKSCNHNLEMWTSLKSLYLETNQPGYDLSMAQNQK